MDWLSSRSDGVRICVRVQPRARRNEVAGRHGDALKIRLQAPPVAGKANQALIKFLAGKLGTPTSSIRILSGASNRNKILEVSGVSGDTVRETLLSD